MKFHITKDEFLKGLQLIQSVVSIHSPIPILTNVLLLTDKQKLYLTATNMYVTMKYNVTAKVKTTGVTTVPAHRLFEIIRELPQNTVDVEVNDKNIMLINCGASSYKILGLSADDFPPMPAAEEGLEFSFEQSSLKEMLKYTSYAISTDESRQILNGIFLSLKDQKITIAATDGRRLALIEQEIEVPIKEEVGIVIPIKTVNELLKVLGDKGNLKIRILKKLIAFNTDDIQIVSRLIEGNYPNFRQVIPSKAEERLTVDRESFLFALRRVSLLTNERFPSIKIDFSKNNMAISAVTPEVGEAHENIPLKYSGESISMSFNPQYLIEPLHNLSSDEVYLELIDDMSPAVIKCDIPFLYVLMPLRIKE